MAFQLDSRIPLGVQQPEPFNGLAQLAQVRAQQQNAQANAQQAELRGIQIQNARTEQETRKGEAYDAETWKSIIGNPDLTPDAVLEQIKLKVPAKYDAAVARRQKIDADAMEIKKAKMDFADRTKAWIGGQMDDIARNGYDPVHAEVTLKQMEALEPDFAPKAAEFRQQILAGGPAALKALVDAQRPKPAAKEGFTLGEGQTRFGPDGQPVATVAKPAPEPTTIDAAILAATKAKDGPEVRRLLNLKGQMNAAGRAPEKPTSEPLVQIAGPGGVATWVSRTDAEGKPAAQAARGVTGIERQSLAFYNRAEEAAKVVAPLEEKIAQMGIANQTGLQVLPNWMQTDENQSYRQAQRTFTEARLRKESGAAIPPAEYENDSKTYFAQPGDGPKILAQKKAARQAVLDGMAFSSGKAYEEFFGEPRPNSKTPKTPTTPPPVDPAAAAKAAALLKKYGGG